MLQTIIDHPLGCFIALVSLLAFVFVTDQLGLIAWLRWLDRHEEERRRDKRDREFANRHWRTHQ
jgi:hypothetical protein